MVSTHNARQVNPPNPPPPRLVEVILALGSVAIVALAVVLKATDFVGMAGIDGTLVIMLLAQSLIRRGNQHALKKSSRQEDSGHEIEIPIGRRTVKCRSWRSSRVEKKYSSETPDDSNPPA